MPFLHDDPALLKNHSVHYEKMCCINLTRGDGEHLEKHHKKFLVLLSREKFISPCLSLSLSLLHVKKDFFASSWALLSSFCRSRYRAIADFIPEFVAGKGKVSTPKQVAIYLDTVVWVQEEGEGRK